MLFTTAQQRKDRLDICLQCPIYVARTYSCGQFGNIFQDPVTVKGRTFKPCGCNVRGKASLKWFDCPGEFWDKIFSNKQLKLIKDIAHRVTTQRFIVKEDRDMLTEIFQTQDPNFRGFSCTTCGNEIFNQLQSILSDISDGVIEIKDEAPVSDVPARIKRSRKKKS